MLLRKFKVLIVNNVCPIPYQSYGEMLVDGFTDAGCEVTVWPYGDIKLIPPQFDLYFFMDIRYDPKDIPWYLNPRVVFSFDAHGTGPASWVEHSQYFDYVALASLPDLLAVAKSVPAGRTLHMREACNTRIHRELVPLDEREFTIGYIGNPNDNLLRNGLSKDSLRLHMKASIPESIDLKIDGGHNATAFGHDYCALLNSMKLCLDWPVSHNVGTRIFEASAAGCAVMRPVTDDDAVSGLLSVFTPWVHFIPYEISLEGFTATYEQARADDWALARKVAKQAQALVLAEHTYAKRCETLVRTIFPGLGLFVAPDPQ